MQFSVFAQFQNILGDFSASLVGDKVYLTWTIKAGNTCNGIEIFRSTDDLQFTSIGNVEGICGNITFSTSYDFTDESPVINTINYYKLALGTSGFSHSIGVEVFRLGATGYLIMPHPVSEESRIVFRNESGLHCTFRLYNLNGELIYTVETNEDSIKLIADTIGNGEFLFELSVENSMEVLTGKMIVVGK